LQGASRKTLYVDVIREREKDLPTEMWERLIKSQLARRRAARDVLEELAEMLDKQSPLAVGVSGSPAADANSTANLA
jgi:hypothetical protein